MQIAIIGAGFSGLALAWHLLNYPSSTSSSIRISLFDAKGIGGGSSGIAAGLLHPFTGAHAKLNPMGQEGVRATLACGQSVLFSKGILRLALSLDQQSDFQLCASKYSPEVKWLTSSDCQALFPPLIGAPGLWIEDGLTINTSLYLKGLWQACQSKGASLILQHIENLQELSSFDATIVAAGADSLRFQELAHYRFSTVKGQVLELEWPNDIPLLPFALNSQAYLLMNTPTSCLVGATFEKNYTHAGPDMAAAAADIMPKVTAMIPALAKAKVRRCDAGLRLVTPTRFPFAEKIGQRQWALTGLGSKGLLYHALMAEKLAHRIIGEGF
jgi:glycine/D-amino acid oxidase-like deaminating enzyme